MGSYKKTIGLFVLLLAILFLLKALGVFTTGIVDVIWPVFLGIIGLMMMSK